MAWLQLHLAAHDNQVEALQSLLEDLGAVAVTLTDAADQPLFEPPPGETPLWRDVVISALFEQSADANALSAALTDTLGAPLPTHRFETLEDQQWERAWMDDFHPMCFGQRLWIVPSWTDAPDPAGVNLKLDPGLAFGTGTHETTDLCLQWLDGADVAGKTVMDFGCGSGVLAIAALLLGARHAVACDIDPQALLATAANAELNGVADRITCVLPGDLKGGEQFELVLANILAGPLVELSNTLTNLCQPGAELVLSGILADQGGAVRSAYEGAFTLAPTAQKNDWLRISGTRLSNNQ